VFYVHTIATHDYVPPPPPPKDHKTTPHYSQIEKGNQLVTSTIVAKYSSSSHSMIKSTSSGKISLHKSILKLSSWKRRSPNMKTLLMKEMSFSGRSSLNCFNDV
jgi:hypothetical protein